MINIKPPYRPISLKFKEEKIERVRIAYLTVEKNLLTIRAAINESNIIAVLYYAAVGTVIVKN